MKTAEEIIINKGGEIISVTPDTTIAEAIRIMLDKRIGAILIKEKDEYAGIWTERDLLRNTLSDDFNPKIAKIKDYMTTDLKSAPHTDTLYQLQDKYLGMRLRHLLIKKNNIYIGMISIGDVIKASLQEKDDELKKLKAIANWEYYENWQWVKKK